ncbi:MAG: hypothetical protein IID39_03100 [Planctomycetes bacterium]|nr:hypothetical protein [Planctomycetota bacterium]
MKNTVSALRIGALSLVGVIAGGCGDNPFGEDAAVPQSRRQTVNVALVSDQPLRFPADRTFNVIDSQRHSRGAGTASAGASKSGTASCVADATRGGSAWAEFQLGHVLIHTGDRPFDASVTFNVVYDCTFAGDESVQRQSLGLKAFIMDSNRRVLARVMLADARDDRLPDRWSGSQSPSFDVTFEPGLAYHLVIAGRVEVTGSEATGPTAAIQVRSLDIQITPAPN